MNQKLYKIKTIFIYYLIDGKRLILYIGIDYKKKSLKKIIYK